MDNTNGKHYNARPGNQSTLKHGGEAAVKSITAGTALTGPARDVELQVYNELANEGRPAIVLRLAVRLTAACDLFHNAMVDAAERGDLAAMDRYTARFGWLAGASLRAWQQVKQEQKDGDDSNIVDAIASARGNNGHTSID